MKSLLTKPISIALLLCLALAAYLAYQALYKPEIEFLRPALRGVWMVHPNPPINFRGDSACPEATFVHTFVIDDVPQEYPVRITARYLGLITINGRTILLEQGHSWKLGVRYDLAPYLQATNEILIKVGGHEGPPALLVEGPEAIRTAPGWKVILSNALDKPVGAVRALSGEVQLAGKQNPLRTSTKYPLYRLGFAFYALLILSALVPRRFKPWLHADAPNRPTRRFPLPARFPPRLANFVHEHGFCLAVMVIVAVVQLHNVSNYAHSRSHFDWGGHVEYIRHVAQHWRPTIATQGWEMFQPPLYYFSSAVVYRLFGGVGAEPVSLKAIQVYTTLIGLGNIALVWWMLWIIFPDNRRLRNLGFSLAALLPMSFYMNSMISNEIFSGGIVGLAIFLGVRFGFRESFGARDAAIIGLGCGLGLLAKYTGLFIMLSIGFLLLLRVAIRQTSWRVLFAMVAVTVGVCGWLYVRNLAVFGDPFIGNWDLASGFHYEQHPGYRNLPFYLRFGALFSHLPEWSRWSGFWEGKYASMWTDTHGTFLNLGDRNTQILGSLSLWLAFLPSIAILLGFGKAVRSILRLGWDHPYLILVLTSVFTVVSLISFTMEVPTFSTIKAFFFLSLISSLGVFAGLGLDAMCRNLGRLRVLLYLNLGMLYAIILYLFWYRGT